MYTYTCEHMTAPPGPTSMNSDTHSLNISVTSDVCSIDMSFNSDIDSKFRYEFK